MGEAIGSIPIRGSVTDPEVVEGSGCDPEASGFKSRRSPQRPVAQTEERAPDTREVIGSIPIWTTTGL